MLLRRASPVLAYCWRTAAALSTTPALRSHLTLAKSLWRLAVAPGDTVVDATCGNGHDTLALAELTDRVLAMDVDPRAVEATRARVGDRPCVLVQQSHRDPPPGLPDECKLIVFNLGYLPGEDQASSSSATTVAESTITALQTWALPALASGGFASICAYPGHPEGAIEDRALGAFAASLSPAFWRATSHRALNHDRSAPYLLTIHRHPTRSRPSISTLAFLQEQLNDNLAAAAKAALLAASSSSSRVVAAANNDDA